MEQEAQAQNSEVTRRKFLLSAGVGVAGLLALGTPLSNAIKGISSNRSSSSGAIPFPGEGSMFQPRADQKWKVWKAWRNPFRW